MKYLMLIYGSKEKWAALSAADPWPKAIAEQEAFNKKYRDSGELLGAYGLGDPGAVPAGAPGGTGCPRSPTARTRRPRSTSRACTCST